MRVAQTNPLVEVNIQQKNVSLHFFFMQDEQVEVQKYVSVLQGYTGPLQVSKVEIIEIPTRSH
jgi:hypothetical protein